MSEAGPSEPQRATADLPRPKCEGKHPRSHAPSLTHPPRRLHPDHLREAVKQHRNGPLCKFVELADNGADAGAQLIEIWDEDEPSTLPGSGRHLFLRDDGDGMERHGLHRCLSLGYTAPAPGRVGMFGGGFQAREW